MSFEKVRESLASDLDEIKSAGLWKSERSINSNQANHISLEDGQHVTNMCANNYLGLANDKSIIHHYFLARHHDQQTIENSTIFSIKINEVIESIDTLLS